MGHRRSHPYGNMISPYDNDTRLDGVLAFAAARERQDREEHDLRPDVSEAVLRRRIRESLASYVRYAPRYRMLWPRWLVTVVAQHRDQHTRSIARERMGGSS